MLTAEEKEEQVGQVVQIKSGTGQDEIRSRQERLDQLRMLLAKTQAYSNFLAERLQQVQQESGQGRKRTKDQRDHGHSSIRRTFGTASLSLREYQWEGVGWLSSLYENGLNGILADEMGLGKTVQCLAFLEHLRTEGISGPFLVVAPLSTLANWMCEARRWSPTLPVVIYHGTERNLEPLPSEGMVITSYEIVLRERARLAKLQWKYLIVDEGHRLKNYQCKLLEQLKQLKVANRLLITGTPLQNNLTELWSLLNFILPAIFDSLADFHQW